MNYRSPSAKRRPERSENDKVMMRRRPRLRPEGPQLEGFAPTRILEYLTTDFPESLCPNRKAY